jgi:hypothetical protein
MYRNSNHEFYKVWLRLQHPDNPNGKTCNGYLLISCFIVGPNERPPVHASSDEIEEHFSDGEEEFKDKAEILERNI